MPLVANAKTLFPISRIDITGDYGTTEMPLRFPTDGFYVVDAIADFLQTRKLNICLDSFVAMLLLHKRTKVTFMCN